MRILKELLFGRSSEPSREIPPQLKMINKRIELKSPMNTPIVDIYSPVVALTAQILSDMDRYRVFDPAEALGLHYLGIDINDRVEAGRMGSDLVLAFGGETLTGYEGLLIGLTPDQIAEVMKQVALTVEGQVINPQYIAVLQGELPRAQNERHARASIKHLYNLSLWCIRTAYVINQMKMQIEPRVAFDPKSLVIDFDDNQPGLRTIAYKRMDEEERQHRAQFSKQDLLTASQPVFLSQIGTTLDAEPAWQKVWQEHPRGMDLLRQMAASDAELVKALIDQFHSITRIRVL
jgi:hypothetical protein